jgi:hypothetical protein
VPGASPEPAGDAPADTVATGQDAEPDPVEAEARGSERHGLFSRG